MSDHTIKWDHGDCDHDEDECQPYGSVTCLAVGPGEKWCRYRCDDTTARYVCEEGWTFCEDPALHGYLSRDFDHRDPGVKHCTRGHRMVISDCNAAEWIHCVGSVEDSEDSAAESPVAEFIDGPIDVEWTGDRYVWSYTKVPA